MNPSHFWLFALLSYFAHLTCLRPFVYKMTATSALAPSSLIFVLTGSTPENTHPHNTVPNRCLWQQLWEYEPLKKGCPRQTGGPERGCRKKSRKNPFLMFTHCDTPQIAVLRDGWDPDTVTRLTRPLWYKIRPFLMVVARFHRTDCLIQVWWSFSFQQVLFVFIATQKSAYAYKWFI